MKYQRHLYLAGTLLSLLAASPSDAAITWTGAGSNNNFFNIDNWDLGGYAGPFASNTPITDDIILNGASVNLSGTVLLGAGHTLTATGTTFNTAGGLQGTFRSDGPDEVTGTKAAFILNSSIAYLNNIGLNSNVFVDSSSALHIAATNASGINTYSTISLSLGASLHFPNGSGVDGGGANALADRIVNAATGATFSQDYYGGESGSVVLNANPGAGPGASFVRTGTDETPFGSTVGGTLPNGDFLITAIPEPSFASLGLLGATLLVSRRSRIRHIP